MQEQRRYMTGSPVRGQSRLTQAIKMVAEILALAMVVTLAASTKENTIIVFADLIRMFLLKLATGVIPKSS